MKRTEIRRVLEHVASLQDLPVYSTIHMELPIRAFTLLRGTSLEVTGVEVKWHKPVGSRSGGSLTSHFRWLWQ